MTTRRHSIALSSRILTDLLALQQVSYYFARICSMTGIKFVWRTKKSRQQKKSLYCLKTRLNSKWLLNVTRPRIISIEAMSLAWLFNPSKSYSFWIVLTAPLIRRSFRLSLRLSSSASTVRQLVPRRGPKSQVNIFRKKSGMENYRSFVSSAIPKCLIQLTKQEEQSWINHSSKVVFSGTLCTKRGRSWGLILVISANLANFLSALSETS